MATLLTPVHRPAPPHHGRQLLRLALPNYAALLSGVVAGAIDVAWVARLGADATAAVAVGTNVENFLLGVGLLAGGGVTVTIAGRVGAGDPAGARATVRAGWWLVAVLAPLVAAGGYAVREPLVRLFLDDPQAATLAMCFLAVSLPGVAALYSQLIIDATFAGHGDTRTPMRLALLTNALLVALDPVLIYGWAGLPRLGVTGAALATLLARAVTLMVGLVLLGWRSQSGPTPGVTGALRRIVAAGAPVAGDFLVRMAGALGLVAVVGSFGVAAVAGYGIGTKILYLATMGFYALRNAATIHTPHVLAERPDEPGTSPTRAEQRKGIEVATLRLAVAFGLTASALFAGTAPWLLSVFTDQPDVVEVGTSYLHWIWGYLVPVAAVIGLGGVLVGAGRGSRLFAVTVGGVAAQTLLAWGLSRTIGLTGIWLGMAAGAVLQLALVRATTGPLLRHPARKRP